MLLNNGKKRIPIGYEDFKQLIDGAFYYVDKSMLIYDLLHSGGQNNLITRPRRFGKTLNFSMLRYFFDITEKDNQYLFDGLKISEHYDELKMYRNTHPVITLSLKSAKRGNYKDAVYSLKYSVQKQFIHYKFILNDDKISDEYRLKYESILTFKDDAAWTDAIQILSVCLRQYYGVNSIILIDEYDVPLEDAYFSGYYDEMIQFIRPLFESSLKTNPALEFSVITGCLRIPKESIFTGLNNLKTNTILNAKYSEYFGFEEYEVCELLRYYDLYHKLNTVKRWYDGYLFGSKEIYNPWSIMNYVDDMNTDPDGFPKADWVNSSSNNIIRSLISKSDAETKAMVEKLINGGSVETVIKETVTYGDMESTDENIWSFLYFTGYLKVKEVVYTGEETGRPAIYSLVIPNLEIKSCYNEIIMQYFERNKKSVNRENLLKALLERDTKGFSEPITELLENSISFYDHTESFYHGLVSGLIASGSRYKQESNRETGNVRSDIVIYQQDKFVNAIILEFKVCGHNEEIETAARRALQQINDRDYAAEARNRGYKNIIKYGVAFKDKMCCAVVE